MTDGVVVDDEDQLALRLRSLVAQRLRRRRRAVASEPGRAADGRPEGRCRRRRWQDSRRRDPGRGPAPHRRAAAGAPATIPTSSGQRSSPPGSRRGPGPDAAAEAPIARRRPISRVRRVTFCQSTPVRPRATMSRRKPATRLTRARARGTAGSCAGAPSRAARGARPVGATASGRLQEALLELGGRPGPDLHHAGRREAVLRVARPVPQEHVAPRRGELTVVPEGLDDADHAPLGLRLALAVARRRGMFFPTGSSSPNSARARLAR